MLTTPKLHGISSTFLGMAPARGNDAVTQCSFFKVLMREAAGRDPNDAYMHTVTGKDGIIGMMVQCDEAIPSAVRWRDFVVEMAPQVWHEVAGREAKMEVS